LGIHCRWTRASFCCRALVTSKDAALSVTDGRLRTARWFLRCLSSGGDLLSSPTEQWQAVGDSMLVLAVWLLAAEAGCGLRWLGFVAVLGVAVQAILAKLSFGCFTYWLPVIHACLRRSFLGPCLH